MNRQAKKWKSSGSQSWEWFGGEKKSYTWFKRKMHASFFCGEEEGKEGRRREENQAWVKAGVSLFGSEGKCVSHQREGGGVWSRDFHTLLDVLRGLSLLPRKPNPGLLVSFSKRGGHKI